MDRDDLIVTKEDREAAADLCKALNYSPSWVRSVRSGKQDDGRFVKPFARHRIAAQADLVEAAERVLRWRVPHDDRLTVTDGSRAAIDNLRAALSRATGVL